MTSQGAGAPFAPGERIYGYQACGLKGTVYIGAEDAARQNNVLPETETASEAGTGSVYPEKLTCVSPGDEIIFRYVKKDTPWSGIECTCAGSGRLQVFLDDVAAGTVAAEGAPGSIQTVSAGISAPAGECELRLKAEETDGLEIMEIVLY